MRVRFAPKKLHLVCKLWKRSCLLYLHVLNWYTIGPNAPVDVKVTFNSGALRAVVSWMPTEGALNYSVTVSSGLLEVTCNTSSASCTVPSLQCSSEYHVSVTAYNDAGSSEPTDAVSLKTSMCHWFLCGLWHFNLYFFNFKCKWVHCNSQVILKYFCFWPLFMNCAI